MRAASFFSGRMEKGPVFLWPPVNVSPSFNSPPPRQVCLSGANTKRPLRIFLLFNSCVSDVLEESVWQDGRIRRQNFQRKVTFRKSEIAKLLKCCSMWQLRMGKTEYWKGHCYSECQQGKKTLFLHILYWHYFELGCVAVFRKCFLWQVSFAHVIVALSHLSDWENVTFD